MFSVVLGQDISILIESFSGPSKRIDPYLEILYYIILYYVILYYIILYYIILYYILLYYIITHLPKTFFS